jgi:hypothetical protein
MLEHALLAEDFYRLVSWLIDHVCLKEDGGGPPLPVPPLSLPASALARTLQNIQNRDPALTTFDYRYSLVLPDGLIYRVFFAQCGDSTVISGADCSDPIMLRDKPEDEFRGWHLEELAHAARTVNSGVDPERALFAENLIEQVIP